MKRVSDRRQIKTSPAFIYKLVLQSGLQPASITSKDHSRRLRKMVELL